MSVDSNMANDPEFNTVNLECPVEERLASLRDLCEQHNFNVEDAIIAAWVVVEYYMSGNAEIAIQICDASELSEDCKPHDPRYSTLEVNLQGALSTLRALSLAHEGNPVRAAEVTNSLDMQRASTPTVILHSGSKTDRLDKEYESLLKQSTILLSIMNAENSIALELKWGTKALNYNAGQMYSTILQLVLTEMVKSPTVNIQDLVTLSLEQATPFRKDLRKESLGGQTTIHHMFLEKCRSFPSNLAVSAWDGDLDYRSLDQYSCRLAQSLQRLGYPKGSSVIHCMKHSKWGIVTALSILRSGHVCVPIDTESPAQQMQDIIQANDAHIAMCDQASEDQLRAHLSHVYVPESFEWDDSNDNVDLLDNVNSTDLAYIIYTSGSTGKPKGVAQEHSALCESFVNVASAWGLDEQTRFLQFSNYSFDASLSEIFTPLFTGGCVCVPSEDSRLGDLASFMEHHRVTAACLTATAAATISPESVPGLKQLSLGGEKASPAFIGKWAERVQLNIMYGTTETGVWDIIASGIPKNGSPARIGVPIGCNTWIVHPDNADILSPLGAVGELCIQGTTVARGYLNMEEITKTRFLSTTRWLSRYGLENQGTLYRTGDLARFDPDGCLELLGRRDRQIKIHGQKVDTEEIEYHLSQLLSDKPELVVDLLSESGLERLVVFMSDERLTEVEVIESEASEEFQHATRNLREILPAYMIPSFYVKMASFPRMRSGKTDLKGLNEIGLKAVRSKLEDLASSTNKPQHLQEDETFQTVSDVLSDIISAGDDGLKKSLQGRNFDLQDAGLTSIQAVSLRKHLKEKTSVDVPVSFLSSQSRNVADIADHIDAEIRGDESSHSSPQLTDQLSWWKNKLQALLDGQIAKVFVTGPTGFLGSQILRQLLNTASIETIILLVREKDQDAAMAKVRNVGLLGQWWTSSYEDRIEIWLGDLTQDKLGLDAEKWRFLFGDRTTSPKVDSIIHNGAIVDWSAGFTTLEPPNVKSTYELLSGMVSSQAPPGLTYVSGGYMSIGEENEEGLVEKLNGLSGYDQTKFVSETLVQQYYSSLRETRQIRGAKVVKPGFIIGSQNEGVSQPDDALWRLVKACVMLGYYSAADAKSWITVAGVDTVASLVLDRALNSCEAKTNGIFTKVLDGVVFEEFWLALERSGISVRPMDHDEWMRKVLSHVEEQSEAHPLYPLEEWFRLSNGWIGGEKPLDSQLLTSPSHIKSAVQRSVEYMKEAGYFEDGEVASQTDANQMFSRTR